MMKKIIMALLVIGLCGCTNQANNTEQTLMNDIKETMPIRVYEELSEANINTNNDNTISVKNNNDNPTLRLDFTYEDDKLVQYVSKEYGFVDDELMDIPISEGEAKLLATNFAKVFLDKDVTLEMTNDLSGYDTGDYITFQDEDGGIYLVQLTTNMVIKYEAL